MMIFFLLLMSVTTQDTLAIRPITEREGDFRIALKAFGIPQADVVFRNGGARLAAQRDIPITIKMIKRTPLWEEVKAHYGWLERQTLFIGGNGRYARDTYMKLSKKFKPSDVVLLTFDVEHNSFDIRYIGFIIATHKQLVDKKDIFDFKTDEAFAMFMAEERSEEHRLIYQKLYAPPAVLRDLQIMLSNRLRFYYMYWDFKE